ncbi:hypothetical protein NPIL_180841 [Nephila pilipes]|uniref:Uncharacterized protein n=1 Tax=Nephila pilipes TaxID=299642 RepID=A0A8X6T9Q9_NEPPI|nr:hypothetical protein NPIL_180841 [Nephila pilipes]
MPKLSLLFPMASLMDTSDSSPGCDLYLEKSANLILSSRCTSILSERNEPCFCPRCLSYFLKRASGRQQQPWLVWRDHLLAKSPGVRLQNLHERRKLKRPPEAPGLDQTKKWFLITTLSFCGPLAPCALRSCCLTDRIVPAVVQALNFAELLGMSFSPRSCLIIWKNIASSFSGQFVWCEEKVIGSHGVLSSVSE